MNTQPKLLVRSGVASINGTALFYEIAGQGEPMVLVHGLGLDARMWDAQFNYFASHFKVLRYDLRGFGKSAVPTETAYTHAEDLRALIAFLGLYRPILVGQSMGGRVVTDYAIMFPSELKSLVLVDAVLQGYKFKSFSTESVLLAAQNGGPKAGNRAWLGHELFAESRKQPAVENDLRKMMTDYSGWHWMHKNPWEPLRPSSIEQLDKITAPTLVVVGENDLPDFQTISDILTERIYQATKIPIPHAGHMSNMENPADFNEVVMEFVMG